MPLAVVVGFLGWQGRGSVRIRGAPCNGGLRVILTLVSNNDPTPPCRLDQRRPCTHTGAGGHRDNNANRATPDRK